jgi:hypothetical protein
MFANVDPSIKLEHSWTKLHEIFKGLMKAYSEVYDNHKKSGSHDDFANFVGNCSELLYLYFWLQEKPQLQPMVGPSLHKGREEDGREGTDRIGGTGTTTKPDKAAYRPCIRRRLKDARLR